MLSIYKASAGSGKTYTLTREYLRMLLQDMRHVDGEQVHSRILAVTFTKKSTAEMKERILGELYILATNPSKSDYLKELLGDKTLNLDINQLQQKARTLLIGILQDYTRFSVSTIDGFFQQVIRTFAKEMGLSATYDISMDTEEIVQQAVDDLFKRLRDNHAKDHDLRNWIVEYIQKNIGDDKQWNPSGAVKSFSTELMKEHLMRRMQAIQDVFANKALIRQYQDELQTICKKTEQEVSDLLQQANDIFNSEQGWTANIIKAFQKTPEEWLCGKMGTTFKTVLEKPNAVYVKSVSKNQQQVLSSIYEHQLKSIFQRLDNICYGDAGYDYYTAKAILPTLYTLGILQDVDKQIQDTDLSLGRFPISKTNQFVNQIIDGQEAPFIYERIGQYFRHYMIDEFQDTSALQWENFAPLIHEAEGRCGDNLIVGDVKQSIYRFRNSDWHLLNAVEKQFHSTKLPKMEDNWRTAPIVILENEKLLERYSLYIADKIDKESEDNQYSEDIRNIFKYDTMHQVAQKSYKGYFHMQFFEGKEATDNSMEALDQLLQSLQAEGIDLKRVTLLTRYGHEAAQLAQFLTQRNYTVQSAAGLRVESHPAIKTIINLLNDEWYTPTSIAHNAIQLFHGEITEEQSNEIIAAKTLPLYEHIQKIIDILELNKKDGATPYIIAFQDIVYQFTKNRVADTQAFLEYWERKGSHFTIPAAKTTNTIQIMTIHSSKGLEFDIVILPMLSWPIVSFHPNDILWCEPKTAPFNTLPLVAVHPNVKLKQSHLKNDYIQEMVAQYTDNLNLTYVALTRARYRLYAFGQKYSTNKKNEVSIQNIGHLFSYLYDTNHELNDQLIYSKLDEGLTNIAPLPPSKEEDNKNAKVEEATYIATPIAERLTLRSRSEDDFSPDTPLAIVDLGILMHRWLSFINTWQDAEPTLNNMVRAGQATQQQATKMQQQLQLLQSLIQATKHEDWFSGKYQIVAEQDIMVPNEKNQRPDRVMIDGKHAIIIDYKFGQLQSKTYCGKVRKYMKLLQQMGYTTEGYLVYVALNEIQPVK